MPRRPKVPIPHNLRWQVWERDGFSCHYCGERRFLTIDHVVPESEGGTLELDNLVTACSTCNREKGTKDYEEFLIEKELPWALAHFARNRGRYPTSDADYRYICRIAELRALAKTSPDILAPIDVPDEETGELVERWISLPTASAEQLASLSDDRRRRRRWAEAERFAQMASERFEP